MYVYVKSLQPNLNKNFLFLALTRLIIYIKAFISTTLFIIYMKSLQSRVYSQSSKVYSQRTARKVRLCKLKDKKIRKAVKKGMLVVFSNFIFKICQKFCIFKKIC